MGSRVVHKTADREDAVNELNDPNSEGTSKDQGKNDATPVEYYNPFEKSDDQQGVTDDMLSAVLNSG
ncbi:MAG: hypothetical protein ASARMPRED_004206 [Alectoria sarmentosa]|nr:MAG: hypothetical protein ASARMPRED_004206 [Alectoria sarmentosa]